MWVGSQNSFHVSKVTGKKGLIVISVIKGIDIRLRVTCV